MLNFNYKEFLSKKTYDQINYIKTFEHHIIESECKNRFKPKKINDILVFAAADHNARMINEYKGNKVGLSNRHEYLSRLTRMLLSNEVDGVEAAPDVIEDLIILNYLSKKNNDLDFLNNKLIVGTVNRGGLKNTVWEMDDMCTCFTIDRIAKLNLDGVKFMLRINPDDELSKNTVRYCAETVNQAEKYDLPVFIETLFVRNKDNGYAMSVDTESLVKAVGVVSALGCTSSQKWLEVPINEEYDIVTNATTCSILVVPDEIKDEPLEVIEEYIAQIGTNNNVRGILLGRNIMFSESDPYYIAHSIAKVWHYNISADNAYKETLLEKNNSKL